VTALFMNAQTFKGATDPNEIAERLAILPWCQTAAHLFSLP
jgi:hypothetical protein